MIAKYFDALTSASFKTAQDGRHLFCPWGILGKCYIIPSEEDYERRRRQLRNYSIASLVLIIGTGTAFSSRSYIPVVVIGLLLLVFYLVWVRFLLRGLQASTEGLSMREAITAQALTHSLVFLWLMEIFSIVFVAAGVAILISSPGEWLVALAVIVFFGLCAMVFAQMLVIRNRGVAS